VGEAVVALGIGRTSQVVTVDMSRETIKKCPEWDPSAALNREYETRLHDHFKRPAYWASHDRPK
jgi:hypothetical protein